MWDLCCHCMRFWFPCRTKTITCTIFNHFQLFLSTSQHCVYQRWHLHLNQCWHVRSNVRGFTPSILHNSSQGKELLQLHPTNQFLPLTIKVFDYVHKHVNVFLHDCANAIWSLKRTKGPSSFYFGHFFSSKSFNHITTYAIVFHLKLGDSCSLSYFPTSTPLKHTSHHHDQPIASHWFLICKYDQPSTSGRLCTSYILIHLVCPSVSLGHGRELGMD